MNQWINERILQKHYNIIFSQFCGNIDTYFFTIFLEHYDIIIFKPIFDRTAAFLVEINKIFRNITTLLLLKYFWNNTFLNQFWGEHLHFQRYLATNSYIFYKVTNSYEFWSALSISEIKNYFYTFLGEHLHFLALINKQVLLKYYNITLKHFGGTSANQQIHFHIFPIDFGVIYRHCFLDKSINPHKVSNLCL